MTKVVWGACVAMVAFVALALQGHPTVVALDPGVAAGELVALTNLSRTTNGLPALLRDGTLNTVARSRSEDMILRNYFAHEIPPTNHTVIDILESLGIVFRSAGENIEWNTAPEFSSVQYASTDFMNSPSHRKNILNPRYNTVGAGVAEGLPKRMYAVVFVERPAPGPTSEAASPTNPAPTPVAPPEVVTSPPPESQPIPTAQGVVTEPTETGVSGDGQATPEASQTQTSPSSATPTVTTATATSTTNPASPTPVPSPQPAPQRVILATPARLTLPEVIINQLLRLFLNM